MSDASVQTPPARAAAGATLRRAAAAALVLVALVAVGRSLAGQVLAFAAWVDGLGAWGPAVFVAGYALGTVAFVPGSLLTLAAGAVFGLREGVAWVFLSALLGSSAAFLLARHGGRAFVERRIQGDPRFAAIDRAVAEQGRRIVFLLRLSPVFPYNLLNYALGLTRISFRDYALASLGMLPGTLLYVYYGAVGGEIAALAAGARPEKGPLDYALLGLGLLATVVVTALVTRIARRALREATRA